MTIQASAFTLTKMYVKRGVPDDSCPNHSFRTDAKSRNIHSFLTGAMKLNVGAAKLVRFIPAGIAAATIGALGLGTLVVVSFVALTVFATGKTIYLATDHIPAKEMANDALTKMKYVAIGAGFASYFGGRIALDYSGAILCLPAVGLDHIRDKVIHP